jgi:hypothetical protein
MEGIQEGRAEETGVRARTAGDRELEKVHNAMAHRLDTPLERKLVTILNCFDRTYVLIAKLTVYE